jgi:hypothetical protein
MMAIFVCIASVVLKSIMVVVVVVVKWEWMDPFSPLVAYIRGDGAAVLPKFSCSDTFGPRFLTAKRSNSSSFVGDNQWGF